MTSGAGVRLALNLAISSAKVWYSGRRSDRVKAEETLLFRILSTYLPGGIGRAVCALFLGAIMLISALPTSARAQDCGADLARLSKARETQLESLNGIIKASKGHQVDPGVFCSKSGGLNSAENALIAYMVKNKDWCSIPDDALNQLKASHAKSVSFSARACSVAAQRKKMEQQQAQGGGAGAPPQAQLPTGPL